MDTEAVAMKVGKVNHRLKKFLAKSDKVRHMVGVEFKIAPADALYILENFMEKNPRLQRDVKGHTAEDYARLIRADLFKPTHQGIAFNDALKLCDGVQRTKAVVLAGMPATMMVTIGVKEQYENGQLSIDLMDGGLPRTTKQKLTMSHGWSNNGREAKVARMLLHLCAHKVGQHVGKFFVEGALATREAYSGEMEFCLENLVPRRGGFNAGVATAPVMASCAFAMRTRSPEMRRFYVKLMTGNELKDGDPARAIRAWLMETDYRGGTEWIVLQKVLNAAMRAVRGQPMYKVYANDTGYDFFMQGQETVVDRLLEACGYTR